jgi:ArsR family metal-binding transcriptional regulator
MASCSDDAKPDEKQVMEVTPCTEDGYVTLEYALRTSDGIDRRETYFDPAKMCEILKKIKDFSKVRCSKEIGYAIIEYGDKRIHIWKQGKIIIRHAKDRDDATRTLQMVNKILSPAASRKT